MHRLLVAMAGLTLVLSVVSCDADGPGDAAATRYPVAPVAGPPVFATGLSDLQDDHAAAVQAAERCRAKLGDAHPHLVLVFDRGDDGEAICAGLAEVFDPATVYGCSSYAPITEEGNQGRVGVLAIAGGAQAAVAVASIDDGYRACGRAIGRSLAAAGFQDVPGQVLILFGKSHAPNNDQLAKGVQEVLGAGLPMVGGAASQGERVYARGRPQHDVNVGVLLSGAFQPGLSMKGGRAPRQILDGATHAIREALDATRPTPQPPTPDGDRDGDGDGDRPGPNPAAGLVLTFNCGGRRGALGDRIGQEWDAMRAAAAGAPLFGFYGSGEIGPPNPGEPSKGVAFHISVCAVRTSADAPPENAHAP